MFGFFGNLSISHAEFYDDVGYSSLKNRLGEKVPSGKGVEISIIEPLHDGTDGVGKSWTPKIDWRTKQVKVKKIEKRATLSTNEIFTWHATSIARYLFGNTEGLSPNIEEANFFHLQDFTSSNLAQSLSVDHQSNYYFDSPFLTKINNFSSTGDFNQNNNLLIKMFDKATAQTDSINIISSGNRPNDAPAIFSSSYNGLYSGLTGGWHSKNTLSFDLYGKRHRPDVVTPHMNTSRGTASITGLAASLFEVITNEENHSNNIDISLGNASRSEAMKAIIMAGAERQTENTSINSRPYDQAGERIKKENGEWEADYIADITDYRKKNKHRTTNGLDSRFGAGQINIENSYDILLGSENNSLEDGGEQTVSLLGFDYDEFFGLGINQLQTNATGTYMLPTLEEDSDIAITLAWNADIASYNGNFNAVAVYDLDLWLYQLIDNEETLIAFSASDTSNTENIWATLEGGGNYFFRVDTTKNLRALVWDYAIAWRVTEQSSNSLAITTSSVPAPPSLILFMSGIIAITLGGIKKSKSLT